MTLKDAITQTRQKIIADLTESGLPIEVLDLILESTYLSVHQQAMSAAQKQEEVMDHGEPDKT